MKLNVASQVSQITNVAADHATSFVRIHSGTVPATQGAAFGPVLAQHTLAGFVTPTNGNAVANAVAPATILADGTPTHASISNGTETLLLSVGIGGSGAEAILSSLTYVENGESNLVSLTLTQPSGW